MLKSIISKVLLTSFVASSAFTAGFIINKISRNTDIVNKFKREDIGVVYNPEIGKDNALLLKEICDYDAIAIRSDTKLDSIVLNKAIKLKVIGRAGIGVDNIDIVFNELDILSAIDLKSRTVKETKRTFKIIRLGTTGGLNDKINVDDILFSRYAIGIDGVPLHYKYDLNLFEEKLSQEFAQKTNWSKKLID